MINKDELIYKMEAVIEYKKKMVDMIMNYTIDYVQVWDNQILISLNMLKMFYT